ncbi:MAG: dUTP diphosphatase [Marinilabiliaceae bacterium]|jgi:dUTP pyrophosphatase|nr:dUTP diphosphatase [Marinilabiliaceae bacterium]
MDRLKVKIVNRSKHHNPAYSTELSAGMDLRANIEKDIVLKPMQRALVGTGLYIQLPEGYEAQIRPRSGLAFESGISTVNSPGTIDADYRGEIEIILINLSDKEFVIKDGERICQMVIARHESIEWKTVNSLDKTNRGPGGFGHTGKE